MIKPADPRAVLGSSTNENTPGNTWGIFIAVIYVADHLQEGRILKHRRIYICHYVKKCDINVKARAVGLAAHSTNMTVTRWQTS